jgi:mannosyltransferase
MRPFLNKKTIGFVLLILTALILRCLFLETRGIWYDDAFSIQLARQDFGQIIVGTAADTMPPLYYFLLHLWMQVSEEIWWLRLLSVLLSLGGMTVLYLLVKEADNERSARWSLLWAAVAPFQIYHTQEIRMYALLQLAQVGYLYFFLKATKGSTTRWIHWIMFALCAAASLYTHNLAVFFLLIPDVFLVIKRRWKVLGRVILAQAAAVVLFLPWIFQVPGQVEKIQAAFWTAKPGLLEVVQAGVDFVGSLYPTSPALLMAAAALSLLIVLFFALAFLINRQISAEQKWLFGLGVFLVPLLLFAASYLMRPIFVPRGFITAMLLFAGMAGMVISRVQNTAFRWILGCSAVLAAVLSLPSQYLHQTFPRSPFDEAIRETGGRITEQDVILHDNKLSYLPAYIYHPAIPQVFLADAPGSHNDTLAPQSQQAMQVIPTRSVEDAVKGYQGVYFVVFEKTLEDYRALGVTVHPVLAWLDEHYKFVDRSAYQDLLVYHYSK